MRQLFIILSADPFGSFRASLASLLMAVLGLIGMISLAVVVVSIIQGDREGAKKASVWFVMLVVGFTLLSVIKGL